jgi:UDP-N-acetylglucosamine acyltransferase
MLPSLEDYTGLKKTMTSIHKTAIVSSNSKIDESVEIGAYSIIGADVEIGKDTRIDSHVMVTGKTKIGKSNHIYSYCSIGDDPQDKKYDNEDTEVEIGDRNTIREYTTINKGTTQDVGITRLGNDNWIMAYVHIAHDCQVGNNTIFANNTTLGGHVEVGDYVIFGGFSGAHQFCKIGAHSFLGMYSGVARDLPPYVIVMGQPAEPRGINLEGLKRRDFSKEQIRNIKSAYKALYMSNLGLEEATKAIENLGDINGEINILVDFLKDATRGIVRKG